MIENIESGDRLPFPLRDIAYQIIISCTRLYTFEKKKEKMIEKIKSGDRICVPTNEFILLSEWLKN